jgi:hypothetical protein
MGITLQQLRRPTISKTLRNTTTVIALPWLA